MLRLTALAVMALLLNAGGPLAREQPGIGPSAGVIPREGLQADYQVLREVYEALHPGLYRYNTKEQLERSWDSLRQALDRDRTLPEAYWEFSKFLSTLRCGHSYCNFWNQSPDIRRDLLEAPGRIPFHFRWLDGRMIVTRNLSQEPSLAPGTEVLSINGVSVRDILERLMLVARADGSNDAKRMRDLEVSGESKYEAFDVYFPIRFPSPERTYELRIVPAAAPFGQSESSRLIVPALSFAQRPQSAAERKKMLVAGEPAWSCTKLDDQTTYLRMPTWALYDSTWDWEAWLNARLDELVRERTPGLVVDLRGNEGGLDCGDAIIARLVEREVVPAGAMQRYVRAARVPDHLNKYLDTWDESFRDWKDAALPVATPAIVSGGGQTFFRLVRKGEDESGTKLTPRSPRFAGKVFVLVDSVCSSATFQFAMQVQDLHLATVIGEPTGGSRRGINGGAFFFVRLPNSRIEVDLPLIARFPPDDAPVPPDAGVQPDLVVRTSVEELKQGVDPVLEAARRAIRDKP